MTNGNVMMYNGVINVLALLYVQSHLQNDMFKFISTCMYVFDQYLQYNLFYMTMANKKNCF